VEVKAAALTCGRKSTVGGVIYAAQECRSKAEYPKLAEGAKSDEERDRTLHMKRSYDLVALGAEFSAAFDETSQLLKR
jgi:hypothetical protein